MTGCAGGLSGGLWAALGAKLVPGAPYVLDAIGFDALMRESAFVVTGEGSLDEQTLQGKIVGELATRCRQGGVTCHAIVGRNQLDPFGERIIDLASVTEATTLDELRPPGRRWSRRRSAPARRCGASRRPSTRAGGSAGSGRRSARCRR